MRLATDPPDADAPHVAPLSRALLDTAALDIVDRAEARESKAGSESSRLRPPVRVQGAPGESSGGLNQQAAAHPNEHELKRGSPRSPILIPHDPRQLAPADHIPVPAITFPARGLNRAEPTVTEDLWAHPTGDIAALVADVVAQLTKVRAVG